MKSICLAETGHIKNRNKQAKEEQEVRGKEDGEGCVMGVAIGEGESRPQETPPGVKGRGRVCLYEYLPRAGISQRQY